MIVLGIDPGGRNTGFAVIRHRGDGRRPDLLESRTIIRPAGDLMADVSRDDLLDVVGVALDLVFRFRAQLVAVEGVKRPSWRVAGKVKPLDPAPIIATGIYYGALASARYDIGGGRWAAFTRIEPGRNGHLLPLTAYPAPLATTGKGQDKLRHERSAYDVAMMGPQSYAIDRSSR